MITELKRIGGDTKNPFELWMFNLEGKEYCYSTNPETLHKASSAMYRDSHIPARATVYRDDDDEEFPGWAYNRIHWDLDRHIPMQPERANDIIVLVLASGIKSAYDWTMPA